MVADLDIREYRDTGLRRVFNLAAGLPIRAAGVLNYGAPDKITGL